MQDPEALEEAAGEEGEAREGGGEAAAAAEEHRADHAGGGERARAPEQALRLAVEVGLDGEAKYPVSAPAEGPIAAATAAKASAAVALPLHLPWSEPSITYDLRRRTDRLRVYEQVLREGTEDDVRYYIDADELALVFDELVLPPYVRAAWSKWLRRRGHRRS